MNGQKIVQRQGAGSTEWENKEVVPQTAVRPGFYYLSSARAADKNAAADGQIIHSDRTFLYQQCGSVLVKHELSAFEQRPVEGAKASIRYSKGKAIVEALTKVRKQRHTV
jgi:cell filamentation protein